MNPKPTPPPQAARVAVLKRYARPTRDGLKVMMCGPPGTKLKVIFDTEQNAVDAAAELEKLPRGEPQRAYECPLSRHGHYHLTRKDAIPEGTDGQWPTPASTPPPGTPTSTSDSPTPAT